MKKIFICIILLISLFTLVNCKKEIDYRFTISGSDTVEEECYINLTTDITYEDEIIWTSSDNTIATVLDGKVTGIKTGEVIITAKTSQYETTKKITVTPSIIEIKISGKNILEVGEEYSFTYELSKETSKEVCWSSSNSSILKIDKDGKCTALKQGSVEVICTIGENTSKFNVSVISESANFDLFKNFGFQSGNEVNKFVEFKDTARSSNGLLYLTKYSNAYISCRVCNTVDMDTHYMFVADLEDAQILNDEKSVTYDDYHTKIKPQPDNNKVKGYRCKICGYIYEGDTLPDNFICPLCKHGPDDFEPVK